MKFACPNCSQHLEGEEALVGQEITCPSCSRRFNVTQGALATNPLAESQSPGPTRKSGRSRLVLVGVVGMVVLGLAAVVLSRRFSLREGSTASASFGLGSLGIERLDVFPPAIQLNSKSDLQSIVVQALQALEGALVGRGTSGSGGQGGAKD